MSYNYTSTTVVVLVLIPVLKAINSLAMAAEDRMNLCAAVLPALPVFARVSSACARRGARVAAHVRVVLRAQCMRVRARRAALHSSAVAPVGRTVRRRERSTYGRCAASRRLA